MPTPATTNEPSALTLGERMVTAARLLAAEHVRQEVEALRVMRGAPTAVFAQVPIVAFDADDAPVPVAVWRRERGGIVAVRRDTSHLIEPAAPASETATWAAFRPWRRAA